MIGAAILASAVGYAAVPMTVAGPLGDLSGTFVDAGPATPVVLIIPGSGPTDRDGNNPKGVTALAPYQAARRSTVPTAEYLALRADKRGLFASKAAIANAERRQSSGLCKATLTNGRGPCASVPARNASGCSRHSEGGPDRALSAGQDPKDILAGLIIVAGPGRKLRCNYFARSSSPARPALPAFCREALSGAGEGARSAGGPVDASTLNPVLLPLFNAKVQPFLIEMLQADPAKLAAATKLPMLIIHWRQGHSEFGRGCRGSPRSAGRFPAACSA